MSPRPQAKHSKSAPPAAPQPTIQGKAWRLFLETHGDLLRFLDAEFRENTSVDLQRYDIMLHVSEVPGGCRMTDLAGAVVTSKSGLTSIVDRLEAEGLIERRPDPSDRRVTRIALTKLGEQRFAEATKHHRQVVRRLFTSQVSDAEAQVIVEVLERVRGGLSRTDQP